MNSQSNPVYLGIDTGGTFTDGVLLDPQTKEVVKSVKVLTTHYDLKVCIAQVLEQLIADTTADIAMVSLSTTLATNAIAEGKRKPIALLLLGYDPDLVHQYQFEKQFGTPYYFFVGGKHGMDGSELVPLDSSEIARIAGAYKDKVDAFAISSYAGFTNSSHEEQAGQIISQITPLPVVLAHHLSSELDSIRRATTASLNASLLSNLQEFLKAVQEMLLLRGMHCPVLMIRGDATIVSADYARQRPVEMIHSGPATSAIGGQFLSGNDKALVIDIGGTTTDISLVDHGEVQIQDAAATIGTFRTCVKTIKSRSIGLGGDSLIRFDYHGNLTIGPERVLPLSQLCYTNPRVKQDLLKWIAEKHTVLYSDSLEYWMLRREPAHLPNDVRIKQVIELLRDGPQLCRKVEKQIGGIVPYHLRELINQEIIDRVGLTPTDLLHITGEFAPWDAEITLRVAEMAASLWEESIDAFIYRVKRSMTHQIVAEIIQFLSNRSLSAPSYNFRKSAIDRWLLEESLHPRDSALGSSIFLKVPIVGIGAPAKAFLTSVADSLETTITFPDHYEVANAVGTVVGNVIVRHKGEVSPIVDGAVWKGYFVQAGNAISRFEKYEDAVAFGLQALTRLVVSEAQAAGAENIVANTEKHVVWEGMARLSVWAAGKPGINGSHPNAE